MQFTYNKVDKKDFLVTKACKREETSKTLIKYMEVFNYFDKNFLVLSATSGGIYIALFATVIGTPVGITNTTLNLVFSISNGIIKKKMRKKKKKHKKLFY